MSLLLVSVLALFVAILALVRSLIDHRHYKRRVQELQGEVFAAQRNLRKLGDLANEVAHEIKNPITAILCSAETLDMLIGPTLDEVNRKSLRYIKEYGDNLLKLVGDFLDVSRVQTGKLNANPRPVKIQPVVETIVGLLDSNAINKKITVKKLIANDELTGFMDPNHLKQILFNLVHNAIKYTPDGGEVHVIVKGGFPNPFIRIAVEDNGNGIPEEQIEKLFDPYMRSEKHKSIEAGIGIGLGLCRSLIEMAGGQIEVKSVVNKGSSFEISVPVYQDDTSADHLFTVLSAGLSQQAINKPLSGQRFLLVDENLGSREAVARLIEAWGGVVDKVAMAVDAVDALSAENYDTVMIDDSSDSTFSIELAKIIKDDLKSKGTTVIMATGKDQSDEQLKSCPADKLLEKPFNGEALLSSLLRSGKSTITH